MAAGDGQAIIATRGGYIPGHNAALNNADVLTSNALLTMPGFQKGMENTIPRPVSAEYSKVSDTIQQNAHKYLSGSQDLETTAAAIEAALAE